MGEGIADAWTSGRGGDLSLSSENARLRQEISVLRTAGDTSGLAQGEDVVTLSFTRSSEVQGSSPLLCARLGMTYFELWHWPS